MNTTKTPADLIPGDHFGYMGGLLTVTGQPYFTHSGVRVPISIGTHKGGVTIGADTLLTVVDSKPAGW